MTLLAPAFKPPYPNDVATYWPLFQRFLSAMPNVRRRVEQDPNQPGHPHHGLFFPNVVLAPRCFTTAIEIAEIKTGDTNADWLIADLDDETIAQPTHEMLRWVFPPTGGFLIAKASTVEKRHALAAFTDDWASKGLWRSMVKFNELMVGLKPWEEVVCEGWNVASNVWMIELRPSPFTEPKASYGFLTAERVVTPYLTAK